MKDTDAYQRLGIYWAPEPESALARFGAAWLGWDPEHGVSPPPPVVPGLPRRREDLVARPARYGFHATLRSPFRPAAGCNGAEVDSALREFCGRTAPVEGPSLAPDAGLGFVSLRPDAPAPAVDALAAACVRHFHPFATPPGPLELARRRQVGLTQAEDANLLRWGYPYVMECYRFHLTLSCRLDPADAVEVIAALRPVLRPLLQAPLSIRSLALFGDPGEGRPFRLLRRYSLVG